MVMTPLDFRSGDPIRTTTMMNTVPSGGGRAHWEKIHADRAPEQVSWYQARPEISLAMIRDAATRPDAAILDVGGGASRLVDGLLDAGYLHVTVLDIAANAVHRARTRLGERAGRVRWRIQDIADGLGGERFDVWHDRAVFHFLVDPAGRDAYLAALGEALRQDGAVVLATFAPDGPDRCSGLPVKRYDPPALGCTLGPAYRLLDTRDEIHRTPGGAPQHFVYCRFQRCG